MSMPQRHVANPRLDPPDKRWLLRSLAPNAGQGQRGAYAANELTIATPVTFIGISGRRPLRGLDEEAVGN